MLTPKQIKVLQMYADGYSNSDIAKETGRHIKTIEMHSEEIRIELNALNKCHAVAIGIRRMLIY